MLLLLTNSISRTSPSFFPSKKWIKFIPTTIGSRRTVYAWGWTRWQIYVAPYSRPVPYSRHPPYSRHFFNDTHENDCVWALFPIAVSGDHSSTQVCKEILSILSIFFGEASKRYHAKLFSPDVSLFHWTLLFLKSHASSGWFRSFFPFLFGLKLPYIKHFPLFLPPFCAS